MSLPSHGTLPAGRLIQLFLAADSTGDDEGDQQDEGAPEAHEHGQYRDMTHEAQCQANEHEYDVQYGEKNQFAEAMEGFLMLAQFPSGIFRRIDDWGHGEPAAA